MHTSHMHLSHSDCRHTYTTYRTHLHRSHHAPHITHMYIHVPNTCTHTTPSTHKRATQSTYPHIHLYPYPFHLYTRAPHYTHTHRPHTAHICTRTICRHHTCTRIIYLPLTSHTPPCMYMCYSPESHVYYMHVNMYRQCRTCVHTCISTYTEHT